MRKFSVFVAAFGIVMIALSVMTLAYSSRGEDGYILSIINIGIGILLSVSGMIVYVKTKNKEKEYVCGYNISTCNNYSQLRKIKYYHFFRDIPLKHNSFIRRFIIGGSMMGLKVLGLKRKTSLNVDGELWNIYFGSSWISITRNCSEYILNQLKNRKIRRYFSSVYAPDELCVPTIVMNSAFRNNCIEIKNLTFQNVTPLHYLNYEDCIKSYDENDYNTIIQSNKMFVRKVISGKSERLIEMIRKSWSSINN